MSTNIMDLSTTGAITDQLWDRLVAAFQKADAEMKAVGEEHGVKSRAYTAARQTLGERPVPPAAEYPKPIDDMTIAELRACDPVVPADKQKRYEAALAAWEAQEADLAQRMMGDVDRRWEALVDVQDEAAHAVFAHPAPTTEALSYKLDLAERQYLGCDLSGKVMRQVFADVRRLLGGGARP